MEYQLKKLVILVLFALSACSSSNNQTTTYRTALAYKNNKSIISVPVRIQLLKSNTERDIAAVISSDEMNELFETVNLIWLQAGVKFEIESVSYVTAQNEEQYMEALSKTSKLTRSEKTGVLKEVCEITHQSARVLNLCVVGKIVNNLGGIYFGGRSGKVIWPTLAKNGKHLLNPATLAHEFGHNLGLKHNSEEDIYLMKGRGNNIRRNGQYESILLTESEISISRKVAIKLFN